MLEILQKYKTNLQEIIKINKKEIFLEDLNIPNTWNNIFCICKIMKLELEILEDKAPDHIGMKIYDQLIKDKIKEITYKHSVTKKLANTDAYDYLYEQTDYFIQKNLNSQKSEKELSQDLYSLYEESFPEEFRLIKKEKFLKNC